MKNYCDSCDIKNCELRDNVNFCDDCKDYYFCDLHYSTFGCCETGYNVECNNGFEPKDNY